MKLLQFLKNDLNESNKKDFETNLIIDNIQRGKILAVIIIGFETVLLITNVITALLKVDSRFSFNDYLIMYTLMILVNFLYLIFINRFKNKKIFSQKQRILLQITMVGYVTFLMSWGSVISLMDQKLYGHLMAFMINMIVCSTIYFLEDKKFIIPYILSVLILAIGLPFFQSSSDVLIGHYVNFVVFIIISWVASRIMYHNYYQNYMAKVRLNQSNALLEKEIKEKRIINEKLAIANEQLKKLTLLDDLTGIPNRRSFWEFIEEGYRIGNKDHLTLSVIMIDIDFFKQYNDHYGHEEGDKALIAVAGQIRSVAAQPDEFVCRWGGEEFIYAAFNTNQKYITQTAQRISEKIHQLKIIHNDISIKKSITVSIGTYTAPINEKKDISKIIDLADRALYLAKGSGRDCIKSLNDDDSTD